MESVATEISILEFNATQTGDYKSYTWHMLAVRLNPMVSQGSWCGISMVHYVLV